MRKIFIIMALVLTTIVAHAADAVYIKLSTGETAVESLSNITELRFSDDATTLNVNIGGMVTNITASTIEEITYGAMPSAVTVTYNGTSATVINPYYFEGVTTKIDGAYVTLTNTDEATERTVSLTGTTSDGGFTYNGTYKATIELNGVSITSTKGAAIDIECGKRIALNVLKSTTNTLVDKASGKQKAALYCTGHLEIDKAGTLNVTGNTGHAISAKEYIQLKKSSGTINILGAVKDGIHCKQYFLANGYTLKIANVSDDGIQVEQDGEANDEGYDDGSVNICGGAFDISVSGEGASAIKADSTVTINNSKSDPSFTITTTGNANKGINSSGTVNIAAGTFTFTQTGSYTFDGSDMSYVTAIKADKDINITGGNITINNTADAGKGLSADGRINISGDATVIDITANAKGGSATVNTEGDSTDEESSATTPKSYKIYVAKTTGTSGGWGGAMGSSYWNNIYLYKSDGTKVTQLTNTTTITGTNGQSLQFYYYDFGQSDSGTYYFKSDDYTSRGSSGTYAIVSNTFTGPTSGIDYYYQISSSYTTSGTTRTFSLSSVQDIYGGGTSDVESDDTYNSFCIKADTLVNISGGTLTLTNTGSMSKSIKAGNSETSGTVTISGGSVTCNISGDMYLNGTDATYCTAIKTDTYKGTGGTVIINAQTGKACHGISADEDVNISDGNYAITNSCAGYLGTNDTYTAKGISCDKNITITGGTFNIKMSGTGGKCIKADGDMNFGAVGTTGPTIVATTSGAMLGTSSGGMGGGMGPGQQGGTTTSTSSSSKAIKAEGQITVNSGTLTVTTSTDGAEGLESKTSVTINGGNLYFHCYDDCINSAGIIKFAGGNTVCWGYGNDAVDSNYGRSGAITIAGGNVFAYSTKGAPEEGLDCDNNSYMVVTGGIAVSAGAAQGGGGMGGTSSSIGSSSQGYYLGSSPSNYGTNYYTLYNSAGTAICTYKFEASCSNSLGLLTASSISKNSSITVKYSSTAPTSYSSVVNNASGTGVFFIAPNTTSGTTAATVTAQ